MPLKNIEARKAYHKEYARKHYLKNKEKYISKAKRNNPLIRCKNREYIKTLKDKPCNNCGIKYHYSAMDFHHVYDKKYNIAKLQGYSIKKIKEEVKKCILLCSNCHRILHAPLS